MKLNGLETSDPKLIGKQLNRIAETARTLDRLEPIGSLYGFELLVQSETTGKDGLDLVQNRFMSGVKGIISTSTTTGISPPTRDWRR